MCKAPVKSSPPTNQHPDFLQAGCPSCRPTNSVKALMRIYKLQSYVLTNGNPANTTSHSPAGKYVADGDHSRAAGDTEKLTLHKLRSQQQKKVSGIC